MPQGGLMGGHAAALEEASALVSWPTRASSSSIFFFSSSAAAHFALSNFMALLPCEDFARGSGFLNTTAMTAVLSESSTSPHFLARNSATPVALFPSRSNRR
eukprot:CAMPEP_0195012030 /NCGR_PEP_ID=MMETSP0326_2-20130528/11473_1 /TAXON_ID=2866 ORGANISM="Crypthecodinium cohnii, Strain Seligo" /NCGR_SAMPLE_ID=MMETSP0326_2 /ASSEMBLY_ACC=CAM_ASM_000348 /LENGTH=101 /DNA_ID=CAMNT_0040021465 /DNA_START=355 /DNA_END=657 /DNA_ORIENTATION=-